MKYAYCAISLLMLVTLSCARLPQLRPTGETGCGTQTFACTRIFPRGDWQFVHAIKAKPPDGSQRTLMGITRISSAHRIVECALMTLEGFVLFQARYEGGITVQRAVAPFDAQGFGQGILSDIMLVFFAPEGDCQAAGHFKSGVRACRYRLSDGGIEDIVMHAPDRWEIRRYDSQQRLKRSVKPVGSSVAGKGKRPLRMTIQAHGPLGYQLDLKMVQARRLETNTLTK